MHEMTSSYYDIPIYVVPYLVWHSSVECLIYFPNSRFSNIEMVKLGIFGLISYYYLLLLLLYLNTNIPQ
jgi:hypothetical protein